MYCPRYHGQPMGKGWGQISEQCDQATPLGLYIFRVKIDIDH